MHTLSIKGVEPEGKRLKWREKDKLRELTRLLTLEKYMMFLIMCQVNKTKETETKEQQRTRWWIKGEILTPTNQND